MQLLVDWVTLKFFEDAIISIYNNWVKNHQLLMILLHILFLEGVSHKNGSITLKIAPPRLKLGRAKSLGFIPPKRQKIYSSKAYGNFGKPFFIV